MSSRQARPRQRLAVAVLLCTPLLWRSATTTTTLFLRPELLNSTGESERTNPVGWHNPVSIVAFEKAFYRPQGANAFVANQSNHWALGDRPNRWPAAPVITGDGFRALADFICEPENACEGLDVAGWVMRHGLERVPIIYVKIDVVGAFTEKVLGPWLEALGLRFVLVTHNGDFPAPLPSQEALLDHPLLVAWFGQNPRLVHSKLVPIPIGFRNRYITESHVERLVAARRESLRVEPSKPVLSAFTVHTRADVRGPLQALVAERLGDAYATTSSSGNEEDWYRDIMDHRMVLSPRGNGLDTHRTWEALYLGRVPVVVSSEMDAAFEGLPVIVLEDWTALNRERLEDEYARVVDGMKLGRFDPARLSLGYHACRIARMAGRRCENLCDDGLLEPKEASH